jgi:TolA-binding protein
VIRRLHPRRAGVVAALLAEAFVVLAGSPAAALSSPAELRSRARQIAGDIRAQQSAGRLDAKAQQAAIRQLGPLGLAFVDLSDRAARTGNERREKETLLSVYEAISEPLDRIYDTNSGKLDRLAKAVMDQDGDLDALYETAEWKEAQAVAAQALYYLNWLHYYGARLYSGDQRKQLLEKAERGFSEFAIGDRRSDLITESLLGRGLCHLELGNYDWAIRDFQIVIDDKNTSAERRAKARLGLLDASFRAGKLQDTVKLSDSLLAGDTPDATLVRYYRVRALLALAKRGGSQADHYRQQAMAAMDQLRRAGSGWQEKVDALMQAEIENPEQWSAKAGSPAAKWTMAKMLAQKGDYKAARPLLEAIVNSRDSDSKRVDAEAHYLLGLAVFQDGDYAGAAGQFAAALNKPDSGWAADASYMRFKSLEALAAKNPDADPQSYEAAMRSYLAQYPDHRSAYEARYRLGEWLQAHKQFNAALEQYEKVGGDLGFELRARFGAAQCRFEILQGNGEKKVTGADRDALITTIGGDLDSFIKLAADYERKGEKGGLVPLADLKAKAAVMRAVYDTLLPQPQDERALAALADFEKKYPDHSDLFSQVVRLRLGALQRLGRFAQAAAEVQRSASVLRADGHGDLLAQLATSFQRDGVRCKARGDNACGQAADQVALHLYELLLADSEGGNKTKLTLARLYEGADEPSKATSLYEEVLNGDGNSLSALRGLARIAEAQNNLNGALGYWRRFAKVVRPGDLPWYEGEYQTARLTFATGNKDQSCEQLNDLKPAMPGLSDADLRAKLDELYKKACK